MRLLVSLLLTAILLSPCLAQEGSPVGNTFSGYLIQTALTPESTLITNPRELEEFVTSLPSVAPFKGLPAHPNPDPFLAGYSPDLENNFLVVATGRDRINDPPRFQGVEVLPDGTRLVHFFLPERSDLTYPFGWGVYTAVVLPRIKAPTRVVVTEARKDEKRGTKRIDRQRRPFPRL